MELLLQPLDKLLDLGVRFRVPHDATTDPQMDTVAGDGEGADGEGQVEITIGLDRAEGPHRGAAADRLDSPPLRLRARVDRLRFELEKQQLAVSTVRKKLPRYRGLKIVFNVFLNAH